MKRITVCLLGFCFFLLSSFAPEKQLLNESSNTEPVFLCKVNGKEVILKNPKALYRTITGGHKQLSLSNDKFEAFVFINPQVNKFNIKEVTSRELYIKYVEPGTDKIYKPAEGFVDIQKLDLEKGLISGAFEMVLINREGPEKKITVSNGKFENVPIEEIRSY